MSKSDIFNEYAKIAEEQGLISLADEDSDSQSDKPKESSKLRKYKKSPYPRMGSDDISTIEALYGVKPDNSIKYENNIMEAAHPKPVFISPSYDRINGLVENNIERQNIMSNIALKPNDGNITNHRYAKKELLMELVRLANDLDNSGRDNLRKIADRCISEIADEKKKIRKQALAPLVIAAIGGTILAGIWFWSHSNDPDKGLTSNMENAIIQLNDLKKNSWYESEVDDTVQRDADTLIKYIQNLQKYVIDFNSVMDSVYKPTSLDDNNQLVKFQVSIEKNGISTKEKIERFIAAIDQATPEIIREINNFSSEFYQKQHTHQSWLGDAAGWAGEALHGRWGLIANDFTSAVNALNTLQSSLTEARKLANNFDTLKQSAELKMQNQIASIKKETAPGTMNDETLDEGSDLGEDTDFDTTGEDKENGDYDDIIGAIGHKPSKRELDFFQSLK